MRQTVITGIESLRMHIGCTQQELAEVIGINQSTYSRYESDPDYMKRNLTISQLLTVTEFYGLNSLEETAALIDGNYFEYINKKARELKMEKKIIKIETHSDFVSTSGSYGVPELKMYVRELVNNSMFTLENTGRWFHHGGKQLCCVSKDIEVFGSRFSYEGEVHPGAGYQPEIDMANQEASFYKDVTIINRVTNEEVKVTLVFTASTKGVPEINRHLQKVNEYNQDKKISENKADEIMSFMKS